MLKHRLHQNYQKEWNVPGGKKKCISVQFFINFKKQSKNSLFTSWHNCSELRVGAEDGTPAGLLLLVSISTSTSSSTSCSSSPSSLLCVHVKHMVLWLMLWEKTVKYCSKRIYPPGWRNCGAAAGWSLWCSLAKNSQVEVFQGCCLPFWRKFYF